MNIYIMLKDKKTNRISKKVKLEEIIYNREGVEFEFGNYDDEDYETLPYTDFLFYKFYKKVDIDFVVLVECEISNKKYIKEM